MNALLSYYIHYIRLLNVKRFPKYKLGTEIFLLVWNFYQKEKKREIFISSTKKCVCLMWASVEEISFWHLTEMNFSWFFFRVFCYLMTTAESLKSSRKYESRKKCEKLCKQNIYFDMIPSESSVVRKMVPDIDKRVGKRI